MDDRVLLLTKIATMYYMDNLSQAEIASIIKMSRPTVSRALEEAKQRGIVEVRVNYPVLRYSDLEKKIKEKFNIKDAVVVPVFSAKDENIVRSLGEAGAHHILENVYDGITIGFAMGKTLYEVANELTKQKVSKKIKCRVVPIIGGTGHVEPELHANELCRRVAEALGGDFHPLYVPAIAENKYKRDLFMEDSLVQSVFKITLSADITYVSAGNLNSSTFIKIGTVKKEESENLKIKGIVGDVGAWFFDKDGRFPDMEINNRVVGVDFNEIRKKSKIVLIAGTDSKKQIIKSALQGDWVNTLITDENVCNYLLAD